MSEYTCAICGKPRGGLTMTPDETRHWHCAMNSKTVTNPTPPAMSEQSTDKTVLRIVKESAKEIVDGILPPPPQPAAEELLPCPFCGSEPNSCLRQSADEGGNAYYSYHEIACENRECGIMPLVNVNLEEQECDNPWEKAIGKAVEAWNRRATLRPSPVDAGDLPGKFAEAVVQRDLAAMRAPEATAGVSDGERPNVICLCGSSKYPEHHMRVMMAETLAGNIVIPMGLYGHADFPEGARAATNDGDEATEVKQRLDRLHFAKIDMADEILVVNVGGYFGSSTRREIAYAATQGKRVRYSEPDAVTTAANQPEA